jgi:hypothetical protein
MADWPTLRFVRIEKSRVGQAPCYERQLPSQVQGVLDTRIHALRTHRAVDMRRIARQEHVPFPIARGLAMVKMKAREPSGIAEANASDGRGVDDCLQLRQRQVAADR